MDERESAPSRRRIPRWSAVAVLLVAFECAAAPAVRLALVVANDLGAEPNRRLSFAEVDAQRLRDVLVEVGGYAPADVKVLVGATAPAVLAALDDATNRARGPGDSVLFYYSGHASDGRFELGPTSLDFGRIQSWARSGGSGVRVVVVDSCHSGALVRPKGGRLERAVNAESDVGAGASGYAILTSSAPSERSQESSAIRASVFTHHLISALRGAADFSGDGEVTLSEAWSYAAHRTTASSLVSTAGTQHPRWEIRLSGERDLVLTRVSATNAVLDVQPGVNARVFVLGAGDNAPGRTLLAEFVSTPAEGVTVALRPGHYEILLVNDWGDWSAAHVELAAGARRRVDVFTPRALLRSADKGGLFVSQTVSLAGGFLVRNSPVDGGGPVMGGVATVFVEAWPDLRPGVSIVAAVGGDAGVSTGYMEVGAQLSLERLLRFRYVTLRFGGLVGYDHLFQEPIAGVTRHTPSFEYAGAMGLEVPLGPVALRLDGGAGGRVFELRSDGVVHRLLAQGGLSLSWSWDL